MGVSVLRTGRFLTVVVQLSNMIITGLMNGVGVKPLSYYPKLLDINAGK